MISRSILRNKFRIIFRRNYNEGPSHPNGLTSTSVPPSSTQINPDIPGLSSAVIHPAAQPVGPGVDPSKSGPYKVPEYFCYDSTSYFEAEVEMAKFRLPQPSAIKK